MATFATTTGGTRSSSPGTGYVRGTTQQQPSQQPQPQPAPLPPSGWTRPPDRSSSGDPVQSGAYPSRRCCCGSSAPASVPASVVVQQQAPSVVVQQEPSFLARALACDACKRRFWWLLVALCAVALFWRQNG